MNIREFVHKTDIAGYFLNKKEFVPGPFWSRGGYETKKVYVPCRTEITRTLQYLNPNTKEWENIPNSYEYTTIPAPSECK